MQFEVAIVGAGPAGSALAVLLARRGMSVCLVDAGLTGPVRPPEVLCPTTRRLLAQLELPEPTDGERVVPCRGVLSLWGAEEPEFSDYEFWQATAGLAVDREAMRSALLSIAIKSGAELVPGRARFEREDAPTLLVEHHGHRQSIRADRVVDSSGRRATLVARYRQAVAGQIALYVPARRREFHDCLVIEAVSEGWWYASPPIGDRDFLVFMTAPNGVAMRSRNRSGWLKAAYHRTRIMKRACVGADFSQLCGTSAGFEHVERRPPLALPIGDAACSLDPLSGQGLLHSLTSAVVANDVDLDSQMYWKWHLERVAHESNQREQHYALARTRLG